MALVGSRNAKRLDRSEGTRACARVTVHARLHDGIEVVLVALAVEGIDRLQIGNGKGVEPRVAVPGHCGPRAADTVVLEGQIRAPTVEDLFACGREVGLRLTHPERQLARAIRVDGVRHQVSWTTRHARRQDRLERAGGHACDRWGPYPGFLRRRGGMLRTVVVAAKAREGAKGEHCQSAAKGHAARYALRRPVTQAGDERSVRSLGEVEDGCCVAKETGRLGQVGVVRPGIPKAGLGP